jgi:hypothetical protein
MGRYDELLRDDTPRTPKPEERAPEPPRRRKVLDTGPVIEALVSTKNELAGGASNSVPRPRANSVRTDARTPVRSAKRLLRRHPFEIYDDQYQSLRSLSLEQKMQGEAGSMSAMVREAIDNWLSKHTKK